MQVEERERGEILYESAEAGFGAASALFGIGCGVGVVAYVLGYDLSAYLLPFSLLCLAAGVTYFGWLAMESISYPVWMAHVEWRKLRAHRMWATGEIDKLEAVVDELEAENEALKAQIAGGTAAGADAVEVDTARLPKRTQRLMDALVQAQVDAEAMVRILVAGGSVDRRALERTTDITQGRWNRAMQVLKRAEVVAASREGTALVVQQGETRERAGARALACVRETVERELELLRRRSYVSPWFG